MSEQCEAFRCRTVPGVEHVGDEVVDEGDLGLGDAAGVPVEHGHDHGQTLPLLLVRLHSHRSEFTVSVKPGAQPAGSHT